MLINKITKEYVTLYRFFIKYKVIIPMFQRFYDWKKEHTIALLNDIISLIKNKDCREEQIYLLDFVCFEKNGDELFLVDGQQRLLTLNFLINAINNHIKSYKLQIPSVKIFDIKYEFEEYDKKYQRNFKCSIKPFKENCAYFEKWISDHKDNLISIIRVIKEKINIFVKKTESLEDAYAIFEQINTGGKLLSKSEVIRSIITQFKNAHNISVNIPFVDDKELEIMTISYYKSLDTANKKDLDMISLSHFLKKEVISSDDKFENFLNVLNKINIELKQEPIKNLISYIERPQLFHILNVIEIKNLEKKIKEKEEYKKSILLPLCLLSISMSSRGINPSGKFTTFYFDIIGKIKKNESILKIREYISGFIDKNQEVHANYDEFEKFIGVSCKEKLKKAIFIMDIIRCNTSSKIDVTKINLEHIYPKTTSENWQLKGWNNTNIPDIENIVNNIGNLMILNGKINKKIQNKYLNEKIPEYKKIIEKDKCLKVDTNIVDFERFEKYKDKYIIQRQHKIARIIYDEFDFAEVIIKK